MIASASFNLFSTISSRNRTVSRSTNTSLFPQLVILSSIIIRCFGSQADWEVPTEVSRIAFASCHKRKVAHPRLWETVSQLKPQAFVWTGDTVYPPKRGEASLNVLKSEYEQLRYNESLGYNNFITSKLEVDVVGTWDDHDYGSNDAGKELNQRKERRKLFLDMLGYQPEKQERIFQNRSGVFHSVDYTGPAGRKLRVILLDTRWNRDFHCFPSLATYIPFGFGTIVACLTRWLAAGLGLTGCMQDSTILGEQQWSWLKNQFDGSAELYVVVSSIQFFSTNPVMEGWGHFPQEQQKLLRLLNGKPVVILSGDVHYAEFLSAGNKHQLLEVTSSGITHACQQPWYGKLACEPLLETFHDHRLYRAAYYMKPNFGFLEIDWAKQRFRVDIHSTAVDNNQEIEKKIVLTTDWRSFSDVDEKHFRLTEAELSQVPTTMDGHLQFRFSLLLLAVFALLTIFRHLNANTRRHKPFSEKAKKFD